MNRGTVLRLVALVLLRLAVFLILMLTGVGRSQAAPPKESVVVDGQAVHPTRILARRKPHTTSKVVGQSIQSLNKDAVVTHTFGMIPELVIIETGPTMEARSVGQNREAQAKLLVERIETLKASGLFEYVEPDRYLELRSMPEDPDFSNGSLWGLRNTIGLPGVDVGANDAWRLTSGSSNVVVAVIDSGIEVQHPDLVANLWRNPREIPGNQIDDDGNGYVDDVHGIDLVASTKGVALTKDEDGHGTHVSGTIAATANNIGVVGLAYNSRLMGIRILDGEGKGGAISSLIKGLEYALANGARVINASFGGPGYSQAAFDAYSALGDAGVIVVCAAGNETQNTDLVPNYPSNYRLGNIISVASVNLFGELSDFSNYGLDSVDLGAPGEDIKSTDLRSTYSFRGGTSMAAPHVAAVAALVISRYPNIGIHELRQRLIQSTVPIPSLAGKVKTGGIINAYRALALNPDGYPEFTLRPSKGHFVAGRITTVEVLASDVTPLPTGEMELVVAASSPVILKDDGLPPDRLAADGVYAGKVTPQAFGNQQAVLRLQHQERRWERQISVLVEKPAENDYFSNRLSLVPDASEIDGSTFGASVESFEPELQGRSDAATVWYRFTPATSETNIIIVKGADFEPHLRIYSGAAISGLKVLANGEFGKNGNMAYAGFSATAGVPLAISVSSDHGIQGTFSLLLANESTQPRPSNDSRRKPNTLPLTRFFRMTGNNIFATAELGEPSHAGSKGGHSLWWRYDPSEDGILEINTFGSDFDTVLAAYPVGRTVAIVSNDDYKGSDAVFRRSSLIRVAVTKGTPIEIAVDGWNNASGSIVLNGKLSTYFSDSYNYPRRLNPGITTIGSNKGASKEQGEINHAGNPGGASVWYEWRAPVGGTATFTLKSFNPPAFNPYFAVYVGPEKIQTADDWKTLKLVTYSTNTMASFEAMAGQSYRIAVDGRYYQSCFIWCTDKVEQGDFSVIVNQQADLGLLIKTGYELNNDAELISLSNSAQESNFTKSLVGYMGGPQALSAKFSRLFSSTGTTSVFHGYTNTAELGGGKIQLSCKFSHSGGTGTDIGWGLGFLVYPVRYSAEIDDLTADARLLLFGFNPSGTEVGLAVGGLAGEFTSIEAPGLYVKPNQTHDLSLEIDLSAQRFQVKLDGGAAVQIPVSLFGRVNIAMGPFILSGKSEFPYPSLLLDDLEVRVLPRGLGSPNTAPVFAGLEPLVIEEEKFFQTQLQVTDSDLPAQQLSVGLLSAPTGLVMSPQGILSWTPTEAQGPSTNLVTVTVTDGLLTTTNSLTVMVREVNLPPTWAGATNAMITELVGYTQNLAPADMDIPLQPLTVTLLSGPPGLVVTNGVLAWTPTEAQGPSTNLVQVTVSDGLVTVPASFVITVLEMNTLPTFAGVTNVMISELVGYTQSLAPADTDSPVQPLTVTLVSGPPGLVVTNGVLAWTPTEAQGPSTNLVQVTVSDGVVTVPASFVITVLEVNTLPIFAGATNAAINELVAYVHNLAPHDADIPVQPLTVTLVSGPTGLVVTNGILAWAPTEEQGPSTNTVQVTVSDGVVTVPAGFVITVLEVNEPPSLDALADVTLKVGQPWALKLQGSDDDLPVQSLTYALGTAPAGMTLDGQSKELRWVPSEEQSSGSFPVTVTLTDSGGAVSERSFVAKVTEANRAPIVKIGSLTSDGNFSLEILASEGSAIVVESGDLSTWVETLSLTGQGFGKAVVLTFQVNPEVQTKFWRARLR